MKNVQPFIDLGFFVVPLNGVITRLQDGKKVIPPFTGPWKELYLESPYEPKEGEEPAITGAFITGKRSGAVSIDCDNNETYEILKALDPNYDFHFVSKGKPEGGGSIIYRYNDKIADIPTFRVHLGSLQLDFQTNDTLQFLPTAGNKSKVEWEVDSFVDLPELKEPPNTVITYIKTIYALHTKGQALKTADGQLTVAAQDKHYKYLAPFIESFLKSGTFNAELFRILTPSEGGFRELPQYKQERTLHPDNVPDGMGNDYLKSVAGVLVCDSSVSPSLFKNMMQAVNALWSKPLTKKKLDNLIEYELHRDKWSYDKDWKEKISLILTDYNTLVSLYYDPMTRIYYAIDDKLGMSTFESIDSLPKHLNSIVKGNRRYKTEEIYSYLEKKQTIFTPLERFGELPPLNETTNLKRQNLFCRSKAYDILLSPQDYTEEYRDKIPEVTIAFFKHLIPDDATREYVLRFILTKLITLRFSEVILYFLGTHGAGKNLFIDWLAKFSENIASMTQNEDYKMVVEVDLENFLAKYNLWILHALFANLDEYGEKTSSVQEDKRVLAQLKSYTGKAQIQLRTMHSNPVPAYHRCTFILTANRNRLSPDLEDRRLVMIDTPKSLQEAEFVKLNGGKSETIKKLFEEQYLFAYYWATQYKQLDNDEFRTPPESEFKKRLIFKHLPASKRIAAIVKNQDREALIEACEDYDMMQELLDDAKHGKVSKTMLVNLFHAMTEGSVNARKSMLDKSLRDLGLNPIRIRIGSRMEYGFIFESLRSWASKLIMKDGILLADNKENKDE